MAQGVNIDGVLITWGDRLFYPGNRMVRPSPTPKLSAAGVRQCAATIRDRIAATVVRQAPQVMVKVTGGGRGMGAITAHFRYISKNGRLEIEDDRGEALQGRHAVCDLAEDWRFGGSLIPEDADAGSRREALNIMLSMPRGTDALVVQRAARAFAQAELADHKYVMVLHDHQANPHVHISVRAEARDGKRLNPRKADLQRWRETFAQRLREQGVDAEATRQFARGRNRNYDALWRRKAREEGRLRFEQPSARTGVGAQASRAQAIEAWKRLGRALASSADPADLRLASAVARFVQEAFAAPGRVELQQGAGGLQVDRAWEKERSR
ncbi:conjugal transfer protein TraS [Paucibacter sp. JuS9]|uniref:relaxase/mobilization nuclease domain-containing protein n=1 Tax=Roseateles TaxID=93681 RepID=UPI002FE552B0